MHVPQPSPQQILAAIRTFVANWFRDGRTDGLAADTPLLTSGIVDSAGILELIEFVEQQFAVDIADEDISLRNCNSLAALTELVLRKQGRGAAPTSS